MNNIEIKKVFFTIILIITIKADNAVSQADSLKVFSGKKKITAGSEYDRTGLTEFFLGKHWRDLWTTPFYADVIDMEKFGGGLTPIKKGGGLQTKSLRLKGNDGVEYKFRSMNKDPSKILPKDLQNTVFADLVKDQISTSHPFSAVIVAPLLNAVGILNAEPIVVVLPNDKKLGEFRREFGGLLGTMEVNPDEGEDGEKGFGNSDKIENTFKLYKKLEKNNDHQVDHSEFLKARLIDIMIGDWDRHSDQWKWAGYKDKGKTIYKPIPRDRDQAFSLYDGLIPSIVGRSITQIEGYGEDYPKIYDLTFNGRYVDRKFLPPVPKKVYDSLVLYIQNTLTDSLITSAVKRIPAEWYSLEGRHLERLIKSRRDKLKSASDEYYELINEVADVYGSDKDEFVEVRYKGEEILGLKIYEKDKESGEKKEIPFFDRTFDSKDTKEIRLYLNAGNDEIREDGSFNSDIELNVIKSKGDLNFRKSNYSNVKVLDDIRSVNNEKERYEPATEDRSNDWRFEPVFVLNSDDGLILGGGPVLYKYDYGLKPYAYRMSLVTGYSFKFSKFNFDFNGDFYNLIRNQHAFFKIKSTALNVTRYYGQGNESEFNKELDKVGYYDVNENFFGINIGLEYSLNKKTFLESALYMHFTDVKENPNTLAGQTPDLYGEGKLNTRGLILGLKYDSRNSPVETLNGILFRTGGLYNPELSGVSSFGKAGFDFRGYISTDTLMGATFVIQAAAGKIWGEYPFSESLFLGGENSLQGYSRERFAGDGLMLTQAEIRLRLLPVNILVPSIFGISVFGGTGRVFLKGEDSRKWHNSYGGTLWMSYINRMLNFGLTVAKSDEDIKFYIGSAFIL
ncbi:MAG TPA: hypothetical protein PK536_04255 [Ignavibacteria bacterium]|nr:hypothetical protein [Bacteroidota bacterium]HRI84640.1 hypothetical protein [Ignavibacteria bacterium]HRK00432.1 hypothetical protein [Ignavibacteria bacterium]